MFFFVGEIVLVKLDVVDIVGVFDCDAFFEGVFELLAVFVILLVLLFVLLDVWVELDVIDFETEIVFVGVNVVTLFVILEVIEDDLVGVLLTCVLLGDCDGVIVDVDVVDKEEDNVEDGVFEEVNVCVILEVFEEVGVCVILDVILDDLLDVSELDEDDVIEEVSDGLAPVERLTVIDEVEDLVKLDVIDKLGVSLGVGVSLEEVEIDLVDEGVILGVGVFDCDDGMISVK